MSFFIQWSIGRTLALSEVAGDTLRIGRGTRAELRSENPAVALEHAVIQTGAEGYTITDLGSITGTYVNDRPVESSKLAKGDTIEIGDLRIEVQVAQPDKPLFMRISAIAETPQREAGVAEGTRDAVATPVGGVLRAARIDYARAFQLSRPYLTKATMTALLLVIVLSIIGEVTRPQKQTVFAPGNVSAAHARAVNARGESIATDCHSCHDPWQGVTDAQCRACHGPMAHSVNQATAPRCASCHAEHRDSPSLAAIPDRGCVRCHGNIAAYSKRRARIRNVVSFGSDHPEFAPPPDRDTLRLNHQLHLQPRGVFNGDGQREVMACTGCHRLVETRGKVDPAPIRFATDCDRCHRLTFDSAFPDAQVPHGGDAELVYGFVIATFSGNRDIAGKTPDEVRRILTTQPPAGGNERAILAAEQVIKTKCSYCHEVRRAGGRLTVTRPEIPTRWMTAKFSHGPHKALACDSCHTATRQSRNTSDVLLPRRGACIECHGERRAANVEMRGASNCVLCHNYHDQNNPMAKTALASLKGGTGRAAVEGGLGMLGTILLVVIGMLLLVVFVPVGLALYQRLRPATAERRPDPPAPVPLPASVKVPPLTPETLRTAAPSSSPAPPAAAPRAAAPPAAPESTRIVKKESLLEPEAPAPTEMVRWHGMLRCTGGPLEGQTFIIEDEGFYIGRDAELSKIVVNDSRVSKRHVRIVPRTGKVWAIDQGSTNGTFLGQAGGDRITEVQLKRGDTIVLADNAATFTYMT